MDEILISELHGLPRRRARDGGYDLWIGDEALGDRLLPPRAPRREARALRLADRLRRLAADARRRPARGAASPPTTTPRWSATSPAIPRCATARCSSATPTTSSADRLGPELPADPRLDRAQLRLRRLRDRVRPDAARRPRGAARRARLRRRRAGVHRERRRLGGGRRPAAPRDRGLPGRQAARARPAHDRRRRAAHRSQLPAAGRRASRSAPTCTTCTATWRACDLAVVQGGLTTAMELAANKRPFLYFPLRHHFEQNFHVRHRLDRYGAGRRMDFDDRHPGGDRRRDRRGHRPRGGLPRRRERRRAPRRGPAGRNDRLIRHCTWRGGGHASRLPPPRAVLEADMRRWCASEPPCPAVLLRDHLLATSRSIAALFVQPSFPDGTGIVEASCRCRIVGRAAASFRAPPRRRRGSRPVTGGRAVVFEWLSRVA